MRHYATYLWNLARRIHADEQGAEGLEKLLIIALIVVPLLFLLFALRNKVADYVNNAWGTVDTDNGTAITTPN